MRNLAVGCLTCAALLLPLRDAAAQVPMRVKIDKVQVGFRPYAKDEFSGRFKTGLWAPVYVTFAHAPDGNILLPAGKDGVGRGELLVETADSDDVQNVYRVPLALAPGERGPVLAYTKPGVQRPELRVGVVAAGHGFGRTPDEFNAIELGEHLYLTLGARLTHFQDALLALAPPRDKDRGDDERETRPREAAFETDVQRLPTEWFGYNVGSSRVDLQACKLEYSIVSPK